MVAVPKCSFKAVRVVWRLIVPRQRKLDWRITHPDCRIQRSDRRIRRLNMVLSRELLVCDRQIPSDAWDSDDAGDRSCHATLWPDHADRMSYARHMVYQIARSGERTADVVGGCITGLVDGSIPNAMDAPKSRR